MGIPLVALQDKYCTSIDDTSRYYLCLLVLKILQMPLIAHIEALELQLPHSW
jgi:hypothetical protein